MVNEFERLIGARDDSAPAGDVADPAEEKRVVNQLNDDSQESESETPTKVETETVTETPDERKTETVTETPVEPEPAGDDSSEPSESATGDGGDSSDSES